jgi:hypothetical protein
VLPGVGHLVQNAASEAIVAAVERLVSQAAIKTQASATR